MSNKLLLADDSITIQKVVGIIFANEDYELTVVDNGDSALEKARQIVPDIMLVDALMPGKNGYEVCSEIRRDPRLKAIPLLLLTGAFEPFDEDKAKQSGADDFISKPFESQQLIDRVKKLIDLGKSRSAAAVVPEVPPLSSQPEPVAVQTPQLQPQAAAQPQSMPQAAAELTAPPAAAEANDIFAAVPTVEEPEEVFSLGEEAIEGSIDDDLWGAFEIEDVPAQDVTAFAAVSSTPVAPAPEVHSASPVMEADDVFSFADVNDDIATEVTAAPAQPVPDFNTGIEPVGEEEYDFYDELRASGQATDVDASLAPSSAFELTPETEEAVTEMDQFLEEPVALVEESPVPMEQAIQNVSEPPPVVKTEAAAGASQPVTLSDAQIRELLAGLTREMIEKIVWEVVPDLAEVLIKEEIKKLKNNPGN